MLAVFPLLILGGSWVVISGVISPLFLVLTILTLLITAATAHREPTQKLAAEYPSPHRANRLNYDANNIL